MNSVITWIDPTSTVPDGPLGDLRVGLKDNIDVAGTATTCASEFFRDSLAHDDAAVVTQLRASGAQVVAKLNMAEFAVGVTSQNSAFGGCRNPWDVDRIPGGSSGGCGVAVAAGLVGAALGTDTGGSVRLPAAMCGVTGLRPTLRRISTAGVFPVSPTLDTVGPLARTVTDVARVFEALAGSERLPPSQLIGRLGIPTHYFCEQVDPGVSEIVAAAAEQWARLGVELVGVRLPGVETAQDDVYTLVYYELADLHHQRVRSAPEAFQPETLTRIRLGTSLTEAERAAALARRTTFQAALDDVLTRVDAILTPTLPVDVPRLPREDVVTVSRRLGQFTYPWSLHAGPTLALPVGHHPGSGMPVGAQLTAAVGREDALFGLGSAYQKQTSWHRSRPPFSM